VLVRIAAVEHSFGRGTGFYLDARGCSSLPGARSLRRQHADVRLVEDDHELGDSALQRDGEPQHCNQVRRATNGKALPLNSSVADAVADCLYTNAPRFASVDPASFDAITIHIDGHTDCVGSPGDKRVLGAQRALSVYSRVLGRAERDDSWRSAGAKRTFLSRIAVRSFGETRPVEGSRCTEEDGWAADRRVIVSVELATERAAAGGHS